MTRSVRALLASEGVQPGQYGLLRFYLRPEAQFDHLVGLPDSADRAAAIIGTMEGIEEYYESLHSVLPKNEYQKIANDDIFGRI